jgi:hypothetical protein
MAQPQPARITCSVCNGWHNSERELRDHIQAVHRRFVSEQSTLQSGGKETTSEKTAGALKKQVREKSQSVDTVAFGLEGRGPQSGEQSGDLQGLSNVEGADSESVDELLEEGNAFEADVVKGVEDAGDADEMEVRTHEVPQDDVPGEYQDKE